MALVHSNSGRNATEGSGSERAGGSRPKGGAHLDKASIACGAADSRYLRDGCGFYTREMPYRRFCHQVRVAGHLTVMRPDPARVVQPSGVTMSTVVPAGITASR